MTTEPAAHESRPALAATAGSHSTTEIPLAPPDLSTAQVRRRLEGSQYESLAAVAVLDEGRLVGLVPLERLMAASGEIRSHGSSTPIPWSWRPTSTRSTWRRSWRGMPSEALPWSTPKVASMA